MHSIESASGNEESKHFLASIVEYSQDSIISVDFDGTITSWNAAAQFLYGYSAAEAVGKPLTMLTLPEDLRVILTKIDLVKHSRQVEIFETERMGKDGRHIFLEVTMSPVKNDTGQVIGVVTIARDITERRRAGEFLRLSEASLANAQRIAHLGNWDWDIQNDQISWSEEIYRIFGLDQSEFEGTYKSFFEFVHPDDREKVHAAVDATLTRNAVHNYEHRIIRPDGVEKIVHQIGEVTFDESGKPLHFIGTVQDITERKLIEASLEKALKRERAMIDNALDVICSIDAEGKFVTVNPASLKVWGYQPEELVGQPYIELVAPEDVAKTNEVALEVMSGIEIRNFENRYRHKNGSIVDLLWTTYWSEKDNLMFSVGHDITERKAAEKEMRLMKSAVDSIVEGITITDPQKPDNPIIYTNAAFENLTGYAFDEIKGRNCRFLQGTETNPQTVHEIREAIKQETTFHGEILNYLKNGESFWNELSISPVFDQAGRLSNFVGVQQDISERKQAEEEKKLLTIQIEHQHERLNNIVANVPGVVWEAWGKPDAATQRIDFVSEYVETMLGYTVEEWITTPNFWLSIVHPEDKEQIARQATERFLTGSGYTRQFRWIAKDGRIVWVESQATVIRDEAGQPIGLRGINIDITERKRLEEERTKLIAELDFEKARLQHIFDHSPSFIVSMRGPEFVFEMANPAYYQLVGHRNLIGIPARDALPELMTQGLSEIIHQVYNTGESFIGNEVPVKLQMPDGSELEQHYVNFVYMPLREADNSISGIVSYGMDVTEQVMSRLKIQESAHEQLKLAAQLEIERTRLLAAQAVAKVGSWETDLSTMKVNWSAETFRIFDLDPNQFEPDYQAIQKFVHPDDRVMTHEAFVKSLEQNSIKSIEHRILVKNGKVRFIEERWEILRDEHGTPIQAVGTCQDITDRKQIEVALQESEKRYRYLTNAMPQLVWATDKNGSHFYYNRQWYDFTGLTEEESLGFGFANALHPDDKERTLNRWERAWRNGESYEIEYRFFSKSLNDYRWFLGRAMPVRNDSGEITQWVGTCTDIEEQKRAEEKVHLADLRALAEYDCLLDRISLLSESFGTARHLQTIYQALYNFAIDSSPCDSIFVSLFDQKSQLRIPSYIRCQDEEFDVSEFPPMPMNDSPNSRSVSTGSTIITDDFQAVIKGQPVINIGLDKDPSLPQSSLAVPMKIMGRIIGAVEIQSTEKAAFKKEHATALRMAANLTANAIENVRLLEQEHIKEEQLRQAQKLESVGRLAGGIAHDFNNMLTAINGYSDLTLRKLETDNPLRGNIEEIKKAGERSAALTHQLLAFSRQQILQPHILDLNETIHDTSKMLQRLIGEDIELQLVLNPKIRRIKADPGQLRQVIMNLTVNARDAMPDGGKVTVQTDDAHLDEEFVKTHHPINPGDYVVLSVSDNGTGMDEETRGQIFEPFFTTKGPGKGTGLGLATVYGIVKQSGGYIWAESAIGHGTTFRIYFPPAEEETKPEPTPTVADILHSGIETILVVEDEPMVRSLTRQILEECGYRVMEAGSGQEALEICEQSDCRIDLLMTDVVMPGMSGRELAERLTTLLPHLKVLFTSGYTNDAIIKHGISETKQNFIQKPFTFEDLSKKVRDIIDDV